MRLIQLQLALSVNSACSARPLLRPVETAGTAEAAALTTPTQGPCDILAAAGTPCHAAHSTVRALFANFSGPLYNLSKPDGTSKSIGPIVPGGYADKAAHDAFCGPSMDCVFYNVFDQSPMKNHLGPRHKLVNASRHPIEAGGHVVYGMWFDQGYGYHVDNTTGIATGNEPESIFAVMSGTHWNDGCCFDYGNSETDDKNDGCATMESIYFGNGSWHGNRGAGSGPWIGGDFEQGMYFGGGNATQVNPMNKPLISEFVSLHLKGRTDGFALKGGDATRGNFTTMWNGVRPDHKIAKTCVHSDETYQPMRKEGAIILATGGDQSDSAEGSFYEGIMTVGATSDATDEAIQANIVAVGYKLVQAVIPAL